MSFAEGNEKQNVEQFIQQELNVKVAVERTQRIGGAQGDKKVILAEIRTWEEKQQIMSNKNKLRENPRGKICYIENDLTQTEAKIQKKIRKIARNERDKGNNTKTRYHKLCING